MPSILIVEDDHDIAETLRLFIQKNGWHWDWLSSGEHVVETVKKNKPDLVLLDIMLPVVDGISCCKQLRTFSDVPIIMMTAKVEEIDRLIGLEAGADDYVCKPFSAAEMMLRVKAILRRTQTPVIERKLRIQPKQHSVLHKSDSLELTTLEYRLFEVLYRHPGRIYSRQQIIDLAYPDLTDIVDRTVDSHVRNLRAKFKKAFGLTNVIASVYGAGYRYNENEEEKI